MRVAHMQAQKDSIIRASPDYSDEEEAGAEGAARAVAGEGPLQAQDEGTQNPLPSTIYRASSVRVQDYCY